MTTTLYLLRHGTTAANLEDRFAGRSGEALHPEGEEQIRRVGAGLRGRPVSCVYCSPLPRTVQSAEILGGMLDVRVMAEPGLNEIEIPHWDGLTKETIRERFGAQYPTWLQTPHLFRVAGCETIGLVRERAVRAVERIMADHAGEALLVVSHLIVLRALLLHYQGMAISDFRSIKVANGEVFRVSRDAAGAIEVEKVLLG